MSRCIWRSLGHYTAFKDARGCNCLRGALAGNSRQQSVDRIEDTLQVDHVLCQLFSRHTFSIGSAGSGLGPFSYIGPKTRVRQYFVLLS